MRHIKRFLWLEHSCRGEEIVVEDEVRDQSNGKDFLFDCGASQWRIFFKKKHDLISLLKRSLCLLNGKGFSGCKNGRRKTPRDRGPGEQKILSEQTHWQRILKGWATCPAAELGKT